MKPRSRRLFLALILAHAVHSIEEYLFRLYDVLAPARWISGIFGINPAIGFAVVNSLLVTFGMWCYLARVRGSHPSGRSWAWFWTVLEGANGVAHLLLAAGERGYFPGAATAPLLLGLSATLGLALSGTERETASHG
jgi:hypothetical protein